MSRLAERTAHDRFKAQRILDEEEYKNFVSARSEAKQKRIEENTERTRRQQQKQCKAQEKRRSEVRAKHKENLDRFNREIEKEDQRQLRILSESARKKTELGQMRNTQMRLREERFKSKQDDLLAEKNRRAEEDAKQTLDRLRSIESKCKASKKNHDKQLQKRASEAHMKNSELQTRLRRYQSQQEIKSQQDFKRFQEGQDKLNYRLRDYFQTA